MRKAFIETLTELARADRRVMLLTSDTGFHVFDDFQVDFPDQYLNVGISEAAMIGLAAGLALEGRQVFVYGIAPFVTLRCLEQIRVDLCYQRLPVRIVGVGAGLTYGPAGPTHHTIEDIAVMNCLPGMSVICPGDSVETTAAVRGSAELSGPCYLRLGKSGEPVVHRQPLRDFVIGKGLTIQTGSDLALIATGNMLKAGEEVCRLLAEEGLSAGLISLPTIKPLDGELLLELATRYSTLATLEEHSLIGGLGSVVAVFLQEHAPTVRLLQFGIPDTFATVGGSQEFLRRGYGLTPPQIVARISRSLKARNDDRKLQE